MYCVITIYSLFCFCLIGMEGSSDRKGDGDEDSDYDEDLAIPEESLMTSPEGGEITVTTSGDGVDTSICKPCFCVGTSLQHSLIWLLLPFLGCPDSLFFFLHCAAFICVSLFFFSYAGIAIPISV